MSNYDKFKSIDPDYQVTALTNEIDLARILSENIKEKCDYVFVITNLTYAVFLTKKFSNRIKKAKVDDIFNMHDIVEDKSYGFVRVFSGAAERNDTTGNTIRSIGFTSVISGPVDEYDMVKNIIDNIENIEDMIDKERQKNSWKMNVIKVIAG